MKDDKLQKKLERLEKRSSFAYFIDKIRPNQYWIIFVLIPFFIAAFLSKFHGDVGAILPAIDTKDIREQYALLGDTLGGLLNPLLSFVSLVFLIMTLRQNQKALKVNSKELELSRVELGRSAQALETQLDQSDVQHLTAVVLERLSGRRCG
ncbi:hypothetical protein [Neptunomonas sp. XY-337]|uniref:hypothetical protein n=1 Tax=Neptunomonas sp. XY-337 TaxID=2561897 RepID=UPI0010AB17C4|nr:hypothetical protein [Neptunomonas sp. XY-337]